jgi:hypothetical protein
LFEDSELLFTDLAAAGVQLAADAEARDVNKDHGRIEIQQAWVVTQRAVLQALRGTAKWPQLTALVKVEAERVLPDKRNETRAITSLRFPYTHNKPSQ